jgi:GR25 family glycosyltransferase involved in LPS biosynthesis
MINKSFEKVYCVNLDRRIDRWERCKYVFRENQIDVERISGIEGETIHLDTPNHLKPGELGCMFSHLGIIQNAKENNIESVLIFEDDVEFAEDFNNLFYEYMKQVPKDWQLLYLGGNHSLCNIHMRTHDIPPVQISENVYKINRAFSCHAYAVRKDMYDIIIEKASQASYNIPIDVLYSQLQYDSRSYLLRPHLCWQREGYSDIQQENVNYEFLKY